MSIRMRMAWLILAAPALLACSLSGLIGASTPSPGAAVTPAEQTTAIPLEQREGQARQVVTDFLKALQSDPGGQSAQAYLAPGVNSPAAQLAGMTSGAPEFQLSAVTFAPDGQRATVDATLLYAEPTNRRFTLVWGEWGWRIESIAVVGGEGGYPSTPEEVVQAFLLAYQEAPDQMSRYLSAEVLAQLPAGGGVGMLAISGELEGYMVDSAAVNPSDPPRAEISVGVRAGGKDMLRVFDLVSENGLWKIREVRQE